MKGFALILTVSIGVTVSTANANPTANQFREGGGETTYLCKVAVTSGSLRVRSSPAGGVVGSLRSKDDFEIAAATYDKSKKTWYLASVQGKKLGWVRSDFVKCFDYVHAD